MVRNPKIDSAIAEGDLAEALSQAKQSVRGNPQDPSLRILLFDLYSLLGDWDAASTQLTILSELDASSPLPVFPLVHEQLIAMERRREAVFRGEESPKILGDPANWLQLLLEALRSQISGDVAGAAALQREALAGATAVPGKVDGEDFAWISDTDSRFGPVLEAYAQGSYYWIPLDVVAKLEIKKPKSLRDCVWISAQVELVNGGSLSVMMPVRYPGTTDAEDALRLCRTTAREEPEEGYVLAKGGRVLSTDQADYSLLNIRTIELQHTASPTASD